MKTVTLIAMIFCVLETLMQMVYLCVNLGTSLFHLQMNVNYRTLNLISGPLFVLFAASLACFFLVLYLNQKS